MAVNLILRVITGPHKGQMYFFPARARCTIGRASDCFVRLVGDPRDQLISRHHCMLDINLPHVTVQDLNSLNGTHVNGSSVSPIHNCPRTEAFQGTELYHLDEIQIGDCSLRVELVSAELGPLMVCRKNQEFDQYDQDRRM